MKQNAVRILNNFIHIALFVLAFGLVVSLIIALDEFVIKQRLYFLRTGNWDELITISAFGILIAYILKKLLVLQFKWGFKR